MEEPKTCPFCGNKPYVDKCAGTVMCKNCYCRPPLVGKMLTKDERKGLNEWEQAVRAWNKRA